MKKQLISLLLTVVMVMSLVPMMATAEVTTDDFLTNFANYGWSAVGVDTPTGGTQTATAYVTDEAGYVGSKSLHVTLDQTGVTSGTTWDKGINFTFPKSLDVIEGEQYKLSYYVKCNNSVPTEKLVNTIYFRYAQWSYARMSDSVVSDMTSTAMDDGWYHVQGTLTMPSGKNAQDIQLSVRNAVNVAASGNGATESDLGKLDMFIDGIEVIAVDTNERVLAGKWGSFEETASDDTTAVDFMTNYADYGNWKAPSNENGQSNIYHTYATVTAEKAAIGSHSLHIDYAGSSAWNQGLVILHNAAMTGGTTYTYTFYTYGLNEKDSAVFFGTSSGTTRLSELTLDTDYTVTDAENGWKKFEVTHTPANGGTFRLSVQYDKRYRDIYIDGLTVCASGSTTDILDGDGDFEPTPVATPTPTPTPEPTATPEPTPTPTPVPTPTPDLSMYEIENFTDSAVYAKYGWNGVAEDAMATGDVQAATATVTNQAAYQGEKSLRVTLDHSGFTTSNTWQKGINFSFPRKFDAVEGEQYKITAYVKSNNSVPTEKLVNTIYFRYAQWSYVRMLSTETVVSDATNTPMGNGWYKIEGIITAPSGKTAQDIQVCVRNAKNTATAANGVTDSDLAKLDLFIDGISAVDLGTGEEILGGRWGNFEDNYDIPDLTAVDFATNYAKYGSWRTVYKPLVHASRIYENRAQVTNKEAASGSASLHVDFAGSTGYAQGFTFVNNYSTYTAGKTYVYTFYTKGLNVKDGTFTFGTKEEEKRLSQLTLGTDYTVTDAGNGWKKFVVNHTLTKDGTEFWIGSKGVDVRDFYLDNFTVTEQGSSVDLLGGAGNFELATTEDYTAVRPRLFDTKNQELTTLDATFGGKTITAASAVVNHNLTESKTAQLIVCLYDGLELVKTWLPDEVTITTSDTSKNVKTEITLPTLTDSEDYKLKVFVWDGFSKMNPLVDFVEFDI